MRQIGVLFGLEEIFPLIFAALAIDGRLFGLLADLRQKLPGRKNRAAKLFLQYKKINADNQYSGVPAL
jgi:hypothetical protein